jgi:hypothetical protein
MTVRDHPRDSLQVLETHSFFREIHVFFVASGKQINDEYTNLEQTLGYLTEL